MRFSLKRLVGHPILSEALRSDEGIADWVWNASVGESLDGEGDDPSTGWTCKISVTCTAGPDEEQLKKEFDEQLAMAPLGPDEDYEEAFEEWKSTRDDAYERSFTMDYYSVEDLTMSDKLITYDQLKQMDASAAYDFARIWSVNEPDLQIYGTDDVAGDSEEQFAVVKHDKIWTWRADEGWKKTDHENFVYYMKWNHEEDLTATDVIDILDNYQSKAF